MVQVPPPTTALLLPATVHPPVVADVKVTARPEDDVAVTGKGASPKVFTPRAANESVWSSFAIEVNVAVTVIVWSIVTWQVPVPVQAPLQPENADWPAATAVKVTTVVPVKSDEHVEPQSMPAGFEVTVPVPVPVFVTESA